MHPMLLIVRPQISTALNWHVIGDDSRPSSASILSAVSQIALIQSTVAHLRHCAPSCIFEKLAGSMEPTPGLNDTIQNPLWPPNRTRQRGDDVTVEHFTFPEQQQSKQCELNEHE